MAFFDRTSGQPAGTVPATAGTSSTGSLPTPVHHVPPGARELRAQGVHRLQVGLFGLAGMLLLVSLANVIMDRAQQVDESAAAPTNAASASPANDPLVDMGVAPELPVDGAKGQGKQQKSGQGH